MGVGGASEQFNSVIDTFDLLQQEDILTFLLMSSRTLAPTATESTTDQDGSGGEAVGTVEDILSDSEWEDIEDEDEDDYILFQEEYDPKQSGTNNYEVCLSRFQTETTTVTFEEPQKANPTKVVLKINKFFSCHLNKGSKNRNHISWASTKLTQNYKLQIPPVKTKQVRFNDKELVQVIEFDDDEDSKQMRKIYWEIFAIDRSRFKERIYQTEQALGSIFEEKHRLEVYLERILPNEIKQDEICINIPPCSNCDQLFHSQDQVQQRRHQQSGRRKSKSKSKK